MRMKISNEMISQIAEFEGGCKLDAYRCPAGIPTIGIGHTGDDVTMGDRISQEEAYRLFRADITRFERAVNSLNDKLVVRGGVHAGLSQRQFDALVSLIYNTGEGAIGVSSTIYKILTNGGKNNTPQMCHAFMLWTKATDPKTKQKVVVKGLVNRRAREAAWYVYGENWKQELADRKIVDVVEWAKA